MATLTLVTADKVSFEVSEAAARLSQIITNMIEDGCGGTITLPNVDAKPLAKILEYCNKHAAAAATEEELKSFDAEFLDDVDMGLLHDLLIAANFLDIKGLLDLAVQKVADLIKGKSPEEIRKTFGITNDFSPEEEKAIRAESGWAFDE